MDTFARISCFSEDRKTALNAMSAAFKELERIQKVFNNFDDSSEISMVNRLAGEKEVRVSPELLGVVKRSIHYSVISGGSFDITVGPLVDMWHTAHKKGVVPGQEEIDKVIKHVGYKNVKLDYEKSTIHFLDRATNIDLGGIVKGYAVDRVKEILLSYGIRSALVDLGGNIFALGSPPGKESWKIGIRHPRNKKKIIYRLNLRDRAVSTSGDYERFFILKGRRFSHIIDPSNGWPARGIASVTVVANSAEEADALSTAVFVMGIKRGLKLIKSLKGVHVFIFDDNLNLTKL